MQKPYKALRRRIEDADMLQEELAERVGMSAPSLSARMTGRRDWSASDIRAVCRELGIPRSEIGQFFFADVADPADAVVESKPKKLPGWLVDKSA